MSSVRLTAGNARRKLLRTVNAAKRSRRFTGIEHNRFWWHQLPQNDYVPPLYRALTRREWALMSAWYDETHHIGSISEINVPAMSMLQGLITGNGVQRAVELGSYYGYSTLLTGFMLRSMNNGARLASIDLDPDASAFVQRWITRAGLTDQVTVINGDSSDPAVMQRALAAIGGSPEFVLLDSSHQYALTLTELDLWVPQMQPGSIMFLHDTSAYAGTFDPSGDGGVLRAIEEWVPQHPEVAYLGLNSQVQQGDDPSRLVYKDGCGLGILQRLSHGPT